MKVLIKISEAEGMVNGYCKFEIRIMDTKYKQKQIMNDLKMVWDTDTKSWSSSGYIRTTRDRVKEYLCNKLLHKIPTDYDLVVEEDKV